MAKITIAKFERVETPQAHIFFTIQKTPESRALLLQAYVPLTGNEQCTDEQLCDLAWQQVKQEADRYLAEDEVPTPKISPLVNTEYTPTN